MNEIHYNLVSIKTSNKHTKNCVAITNFLRRHVSNIDCFHQPVLVSDVLFGDGRTSEPKGVASGPKKPVCSEITSQVAFRVKLQVK